MERDEKKHKDGITVLLEEARGGNQSASNHLFDLVYSDLRGIARAYMAKERANHTLQPTAVVHEAYLRVFQGAPIEWRNRAQFFAIAARQMRRVLIDYGRDYHAQKRDGRLKIGLENVNLASPLNNQDIEEIDDLLRKLEENDAAAAQVVESKFFAGMTDKEIAESLGVSIATVRRHWDFARAWILNQMSSKRT